MGEVVVEEEEGREVGEELGEEEEEASLLCKVCNCWDIIDSVGTLDRY